MKYFIFLIISFIPFFVNASTYTSTEDLFENSYSNNLIDMAQSRINDFNSKKYVILHSNYDYYLISSYEKDITVSGSTITFNNSSIIRAIRGNSSSGYRYTYSDINEANTVVKTSYIVISNLDTNYSVSSKRYEDFSFYNFFRSFGVFIIGLLFAIFLMKGRNYL